MARVVFVTTRLPWPPTEGHQLRSYHLLRAAARKHDVTLLSLARKEDRRDEVDHSPPLVGGLGGRRSTSSSCCSMAKRLRGRTCSTTGAPGRLSTSIDPPIACASREQIASPSPLPSFRFPSPL